MTPLERHKNNATGAYINWKKCLNVVGINVPVIARQCVESILKAIIAKANIPHIGDLDLKKFYSLKNSGYFPIENKRKNIKGITSLGIEACLFVIKNENIYSITKDIETKIDEIQYLGNKSAHGNDDDPTNVTKQNDLFLRIQKIDPQLDEIAEWFFGTYENKPDWKFIHVIPELDIANKISKNKVAENIAEKLKTELSEFTKSNSGSEETKLTIQQLNEAILKLENILNEMVEKTAERTEKIIKKDADRIIGKQDIGHNKILEAIQHLDRKQWKRIFAIAFLPMIFFITFYFSSNKVPDKEFSSTSNLTNKLPFDTTKKDSYKVLLFPFQPLEKCQFKQTNIEHTIRKRLLEMNEKDRLNLQIYFDTTQCINSYSEADSIGRMMNADLVIWGELYEQCENDTEKISLRYTNITLRNYVPGIKIKNENEINNIVSLSEIREGKLQMDIDYIIYWVAGFNALSKNDFSTALSHFMKIKNLNIFGETVIAMCYSNLELYDKAKRQYEDILKKDPYFVLAMSNYAALLGDKLNDREQSVKYFERAIQISSNPDKFNSSNNINNSYTLGIIYRNYAAVLSEKFQDYEQAREFLEYSLKYIPNDETAHCEYAKLLHTQFADFNSAKKHYEIALGINPLGERIHFLYAIFLKSSLNDYTESKVHFEKSLELNPNYGIAHLNYAHLLSENLNDYIAAKKHYEKALESISNIARTHFEYANFLYVRIHDFAAANEHYEKGLEIEPQNALAHYNYSVLLYLKFKNYSRAKEHYNEALKLDKSMKNSTADSLFKVVRL